MTNQKDLENFTRNEVYVCISSIVNELLNCSNDFQNAYDDECLKLDRQDGEDWQEVYSVTSFLAERLKKHGQLVVNYGGHDLWFRHGGGQAVFMDSVIQDIYNELRKYKGE